MPRFLKLIVLNLAKPTRKEVNPQTKLLKFLLNVIICFGENVNHFESIYTLEIMIIRINIVIPQRERDYYSTNLSILNISSYSD